MISSGLPKTIGHQIFSWQSQKKVVIEIYQGHNNSSEGEIYGVLRANDRQRRGNQEGNRRKVRSICLLQGPIDKICCCEKSTKVCAQKASVLNMRE